MKEVRLNKFIYPREIIEEACKKFGISASIEEEENHFSINLDGIREDTKEFTNYCLYLLK